MKAHFANKTSRLDRGSGIPRFRFVPLIELLEARQLLASDFGDAPFPYPTRRTEGGAEHMAVGPTLGTHRDTEVGGTHSAGADGDDKMGSPDDEDGVTFRSFRASQLGAMAMVNVAGGSAKLDAWIDFNGDGSWGGPGEQIADRLSMVPGSNSITFDVPSWAIDGRTFARFRLSTAGDLGVGGHALDGEVEDYAVTIQPPKAACGCFSDHTISASTQGHSSVHAADVDGDGDTDVLSASRFDDTIAWYENDGGQNFSKRIISTNAEGARSVYSVDLDGDGDSDVLSASSIDDKVAWYENDGSQNFTAHVISTDADAAYEVHAGDVDRDGDIDVLSASRFDDTIAWYENDGGQNFTKRIISTVADGATSVRTADVDGDGHTDVLSASIADDTIAWYQNDGSQNFTEHAITTAEGGAYSVFASDVDGDGDTDVLSASLFDDRIVWYENDGHQNFASRIISATAVEAKRVYAADVDGDRDADVVAVSVYGDKIAWYENDGRQNFTAHTVDSAFDWDLSVFVVDVDGDEDLDIVYASDNPSSIGWYENQQLEPIGQKVLIDKLRRPAPELLPLTAPLSRRRLYPPEIVRQILAEATDFQTEAVLNCLSPIVRQFQFQRIEEIDLTGILYGDFSPFEDR
jgi:hypothetical protein